MDKTETIKRKWPQVALVILALYTCSLAVATADEVFHLGIFPTRLERMISKAINNLKSSDPQVSAAAKKELELYGDFAIPQLIKALNDSATKTQALELLKSATGKDLGPDPKEWKDWYSRHKNEF